MFIKGKKYRAKTKDELMSMPGAYQTGPSIYVPNKRNCFFLKGMLNLYTNSKPIEVPNDTESYYDGNYSWYPWMVVEVENKTTRLLKAVLSEDKGC